MAYNGRALAAAGAGMIFIWSGIKGWSVLATIGDVLTGKKPNEPVSLPLDIAGGSTQGGGSGSASGIAGIALQYVGHAYLYGGAPGTDGKKPWDCSSFINYVVAVRGGMAIPGNAPGKYTGSTHGPPTGMWAAWTGMGSVKRSDVQAGDILVWFGHMAMAINNTQCVSALNPRTTTKVTTIESTHTGPILRMGRLNG